MKSIIIKSYPPIKVISDMSYFLYPKGDVKKCKFCGGNGIIYVWRSDLEDFEEIICPECNDRED